MLFCYKYIGVGELGDKWELLVESKGVDIG